MGPLPRAREAWAEWAAQSRLDDVSWEDIRLLGVAAMRSRELGVTDADRPRLEGIRRFVWSCTQVRLAAAMPALRALVSRGVPVCLLKGAALLAAGHLRPGERYLRDVDVLVPRSHIVAAVEALLAAGWTQERYGTAERIFTLGYPRLHALEFRSPDKPDCHVDLHLSASELNRFVDDDATLWEGAAETRFFGLPLRVPRREHLLCLGLVHSHLSDREQGLDWAVDAAALARGSGFDWPLLRDECYRRGAEALVGQRLAELAAVGAVPLPGADLVGVEATADAAVWRQELEGLARRPRAGRVTQGRAFLRAHAERARRSLARSAECAHGAAASLPPGVPWLRLDVPIPEGLEPAGGRKRLEIRARIHGARRRRPIRFWLYCGSTRLARGRTLPLPARGAGGSHVLRASVDLDPRVVAGEGWPPVSVYLGRRRSVSRALGEAAHVEVERVRMR